MSMSAHVIGFRPPDEKWRKMKAVYDTCRDAGVSPPKEVSEFFNYLAPDDNGVQVKIPYKCHKYDMIDGYEVILSELPKDIKVIRFYISY